MPRQAATVILLRGGEAALEVLLVQRNPAQRFMGGAWVFPGGAVDAGEGSGEDSHRAAAVRELDDFPLEARMGHQVTLAARERGAIVRPLGDTIVLMPPLSISDDELRRLVGITAEAIAAAAGAGTLGAPAAVASL